MKKGFLRFIAVIMVVLMTAVYLPTAEIDNTFGVEASALITKDVSLGGNVKWKYDAKNNIVTLYGSGNMKNFGNGDDGQRWDEIYKGTAEKPINKATKIVISNGITNIGNNTFVGFKELREVVIPASVQSIGSSAFKNCAKLTTIQLPSGISVINSDTFYGCSSLSSINIPASVTAIGANAFRGCSLGSVTLPTSVTTINSGAFQDCSSLTSCSLHEGLTTIGANAFSNTRFASVTMPYSVTSIGSNAFSGISGLRITCNYGDAAYNYCRNHSVAYIFRQPSLKVEITPTNVNSQVLVSLYVKDASGLNAANFDIKYNSDIYPASDETVVSQTDTKISALRYGENNTISAGVAVASEIAYSECGSECSIKIADITFNLAPGTHVVEIDFSSSIFMLQGSRYSIAPVSGEFGEHNFVLQGGAVPPTCVDYGYTLYKCTICGEERELNIVPALGHAYNDGVVTPPTCDDDGFTTISCSRCNDSYTVDIVEATGHTITTIDIVGTCIAKGNKTIICTVCSKTNVVEEYEIDPNNHVNTEIINTKEPTCAEKGYTGDTYCTDCKLIVTGGNEIETIPHSFNDVVTAPTCTEQGYTTHTCSCGASYTDAYVDATGHSEEIVAGYPATCTETGLSDGVMCSVCNEVLDAQDVIPATGHDYVAVVTAPTCTEKGYTTHTCTVCNDSYKDSETDVIAHSYNSAVTAPTCTEQGYTTYTCSCGDTYKDDYVDATGHDYVAVVTAPTCTEQGYTTYTCSCNDTYKDNYVDATGHTATEIPAVAPTCETTGLTAGSKCSVCDKVLVAQEVVPALGHITVEIPAVAATCEETGLTAGSKCSVCDKVLVAQEEVPALGHDYVSVVTAPTCTAKGYTTHTCTACGDSYKDSETDMIAHVYGDDGKCSVCGIENPDKPSDNELKFDDEKVYTINDTAKNVVCKNNVTVAELKNSIIPKGWVITDADGNTLADDKAAATGCFIKSETGNDLYAFVVLGDVNMDGKLSAADARLALRISAKLETGTELGLIAANCDGNEKVTAADARIILRVSAKLQSFE